jgi:hypothetical protein
MDAAPASVILTSISVLEYRRRYGLLIYITESLPMSDLYNWKVAVDQCHQKHIGPPPALHRRIAYLEAHSDAPRAEPPVSRLKLFLRLLTHRREA